MYKGFAEAVETNADGERRAKIKEAGGEGRRTGESQAGIRAILGGHGNDAPTLRSIHLGGSGLYDERNTQYLAQLCIVGSIVGVEWDLPAT
ncbi:MAG: hypothetical protein QMD53_06635 [Actinomycetota bacterium]|nr:hypothetical protein [Actinomycetota bacterium]